MMIRFRAAMIRYNTRFILCYDGGGTENKKEIYAMLHSGSLTLNRTHELAVYTDLISAMTVRLFSLIGMQ
jgi:hypothetical protein